MSSLPHVFTTPTKALVPGVQLILQAHKRFQQLIVASWSNFGKGLKWFRLLGHLFIYNLGNHPFM